MDSVARATAEIDTRPGRSCPVSYRYPPGVFAREPQLVAETLFVGGGLYGKVEALDAVLELAAAEPARTAIAFNGDFHWFDIEARDYERIAVAALSHAALRGNVETELASEELGVGCGCAYPDDVDDAEVGRSNLILQRLRDTARIFPQLRERQGKLPMHLTARVGEARIGIVHGDASSLAGWGFAIDQLDNPRRARWIESVFREARVDVFASSHTCAAGLRRFAWEGVEGVVINNGAAGMPNFAATSHGVVTRISVNPAPGPVLYGTQARGVFVDALALPYDAGRWHARFLAAWPAGSPAHDSYHRRIIQGPRHRLEQAMP